MVWDVPKSEKWTLYVFFSSFVRGYFGKSQFILEKRGNDFLSIWKQKCIIGQNELGSSVDLKPLWVKFSSFFWPRKKFRTSFPEKIGKKLSKNGQKWHFWDQGELTCVLQVKITLFYCKMMNSVMALEFWAPKVIFWCNFRRIFVQKLVKMVNFGELWPKFGHLKPI